MNIPMTDVDLDNRINRLLKRKNKKYALHGEATLDLEAN